MRLLAIVASVAVALFAAGTAAATGPEMSTQEFAFTGVDTSTCGFPLQTSFSVELTTWTFYDSEGAVARTTTHARAQGTYTSAEGLTAQYDQVMNSTVDASAGTQTITGSVVRVMAPGAGLLLQDVGRLVFRIGFPPEIVFESGRHPIFEPGAWDGVCAYLAG